MAVEQERPYSILACASRESHCQKSDSIVSDPMHPLNRRLPLLGIRFLNSSMVKVLCKNGMAASSRPMAGEANYHPNKVIRLSPSWTTAFCFASCKSGECTLFRQL